MSHVTPPYFRGLVGVLKLMPQNRVPPRLRRHLAIVAGVGLAVALAWAAVMLTFPLLTGSDVQARWQGAAVVALGFPLMSASRFLVPAAMRVGIEPFAVSVGCAFLNGAFWATALLAFRQAARQH